MPNMAAAVAGATATGSGVTLSIFGSGGPRGIAWIHRMPI